MNKVDKLQNQIDELTRESELKKSVESSVSSGKATPSSSGSRNSPKIEHVTPVATAPARSQIPPASAPAAPNGARKRKTKERTPTVTTAASPLPDFSHFVNGFMFDPMNPMINSQAGMMQLLSLVQQQQGQSGAQQAAPMQHAQSLSPPEPKAMKVDEPSFDITPLVKDETFEEMKSEVADVEMTPEAIASHGNLNLLEVLTAQLSNQAVSAEKIKSVCDPLLRASVGVKQRKIYHRFVCARRSSFRIRFFN